MVIDNEFNGFDGKEPVRDAMGNRILELILVGLRYGEVLSWDDYARFATLLAQKGLFQLLEDMLCSPERWTELTNPLNIFVSKSVLISILRDAATRTKYPSLCFFRAAQ